MNASTTPPTDPMSLPQGDLRLLDTEVAKRLLGSTELARVAYIAGDGTPRVDPVMFVWMGDELVFATFQGSFKIRSLRARPDVTLVIDTPGPIPNVLHIRGKAVVTDVDGIVPEYAMAHRRYYGEEQGAANVAAVDQPGTKMARVAIRPTWVGLLDFQTRLPGAISGGR
jgi:pyridoxamine 5'-phosphate oxidase-like protein